MISIWAMGGLRMRITKQWWTQTAADYQLQHSKTQHQRQQFTHWRSERERSLFLRNQLHLLRCTGGRWARTSNLQGWRSRPRSSNCKTWRKPNWKPKPNPSRRSLLKPPTHGWVSVISRAFLLFSLRCLLFILLNNEPMSFLYVCVIHENKMSSLLD